MRTLKYLPLLIFCFPLFVHGQVDSDALSVYHSFLKDKRDITLFPAIGSYTLGQIKNALATRIFTKPKITGTGIHGEKIFIPREKIILSKNERKHINSCLASFTSFRWSKPVLEETGLSRFKLRDRDTLASDERNSWYGIVYTIMPPIFIRSHTICFLYFDYHCGALCGQGELDILKKVDNKWVEWNRLIDFVE